MSTLNTEQNTETKQPEVIEPQVIVSLTTIPQKFDYLKKNIASILSQTAIEVVSKIYINLDDDISDEDFAKYIYFKGLDKRIIVQKVDEGDCKWRSANKLLPVYAKHYNDIIITFDDDKMYPKDAIAKLLQTWRVFPTSIVAYEVNPVVITKDNFKKEFKIAFTNSFDVMLDQLQWGKYLSNACLFCPLAFGPPESYTFKELYNFENYNYVVKAKHDEVWFWIISTLYGTQCVGLADTFSFELDDINFAKTEYDLSNINGQVDEIRGYNERINEVYGKSLIEAIRKKPVVFILNPMTVQLAAHELQRIRRIYANQNVIFFGKHVAKSWLTYLGHHLKKIDWDVPVIY